MAKPGSPSRIDKRAEEAATGTRRELVDAAIGTLREQGFAGTSARAIARRAGCNQALVFYHFGSVANLLLAALDETSRVRMERYREAVTGASGPGELAAVAADIYREDLEAGHLAVLAEMIAGASSVPGLGAEVAARIAPWIDFTEEAVGRVLSGTAVAALVPGRDLAYGIVALYLGVELLANLDGEREAADSLFATAGRLSALLGAGLAAPADEAAEVPEP